VAAPLARSAAERPFDVALRGGYDTLRTGKADVVVVAGEYRHTRGTTLYTADAHLDQTVMENVLLLADVRNVVVNGRAVRQLTGAVAPFNVDDVSGSAGISVVYDDAKLSLEGLYGRSGFGGRVGMTTDAGDWQLGLRAAWHEPYTDTAEAVALKGSRDYTALFAAGQIFDGLWATGEASATRDVHQFGGSFSDDFEPSLWFDLYGGYAIDRYSKDGPYGGAALRFTPEPGFDIALDGRYSTVSERQGEPGNVLSAGIRLTYAWGAVDAPIFHLQ